MALVLALLLASALLIFLACPKLISLQYKLIQATTNKQTHAEQKGTLVIGR